MLETATEPTGNHTTIANTDREKLRNEMISHVAQENKAYFRSQQINDPDISLEERKNIVEQFLNDGNEKFLARFGNFITLNHLAYFEWKDGQESPENDTDYELKYFLKNIRENLHNRQQIVKNRRFAAMQQLIDNKEYFSEIEMMRREPLLYEHLIGQYLTVNERVQRDASNSDGPEFSNVLLHGIDMKNIAELRAQQQTAEEDVAVDDDDSSSNDVEKKSTEMIDSPEFIEEQLYPQIPPNLRQHWGDFDDESPQSHRNSSAASASGSSQNKCTVDKVHAEIKCKIKNEAKQSYISTDERELLREEFFSIMCSNFLQGKDTAFDYTTVDDNHQYDDIETENQDAEDKYFESSEEGSDIGAITPEQCNESEDELDSYMKNINEKTT